MIDEHAIIQKCLSGDINSYGSIVREYESPLLHTAFRFLRNWDDAKDVVQETFIKAYNALERYNFKYSFKTWLYKILVNGCLDRLKSAHYKYRSSLFKKNLKDPSETRFENQIEEKELIFTALEQLPIKRRKVLMLIDCEGFTGPEAAEILGCTQSTIRVTLMKARQQLRKIYLSLNRF